MSDFRQDISSVRFEYFIRYFYWSLRYYDADPSMFLINYVNERMEHNIEQRFWFAWLYANTYQLATAYVILSEFPDFENVDLNRLTEWNNSNYKRLRYQSDQKWQKGHLPEMFKSYRDNIYSIGKTQKQFFSSICNKNDTENFDVLYKYVYKKFFKFGRYTAWFYLQTLKETCDVNVTPKNLLLNDPNTHTQRDGLCRAIAFDEYVGNKELIKDKEIINFLDVSAEKILFEIKIRYPDIRADYFLLETVLCAFKKTFRVKKGRYLGYYLDRQFEDIKQVENDGWFGVDFDLMWDGRNEILDRRTNRSTGVIEEDMKFFLETGQIKYYEYLQS